MPVTPEQEWEYWDSRATELRRGQLGTVQSSATKWAALMTALLGIFGTVAFAGGLTTLDKLPNPWVGIAKVLTLVAAASAITAIVFLGVAAGGLLVSRHGGFTPELVRDMNTVEASGALNWLRRGQMAAVLAAALVIVGSGIVLWVGEKPSNPEIPKVVAVVNGNAICGSLARMRNGELAVGSTTLAHATSVTVVGSCP